MNTQNLIDSILSKAAQYCRDNKNSPEKKPKTLYLDNCHYHKLMWFLTQDVNSHQNDQEIKYENKVVDEFLGMKVYKVDTQKEHVNVY